MPPKALHALGNLLVKVSLSMEEVAKEVLDCLRRFVLFLDQVIDCVEEFTL